MTRYAGNAEALRALVRDQEVHRDVYVSEGQVVTPNQPLMRCVHW